MSYVAEAPLAGHHGCRSVEGDGEFGRQIADGPRRPRADVVRAKSLVGSFGCGEDRARNVADMHEVPALAAVLEDAGCDTATQSCGEERRDPGVRRVARHTWSVHVVEAQGGGRAGGLARPGHGVVFLCQFGDGIGVARVRRSGLIDQGRCQHPATGDAVRFEITGFQIDGCARQPLSQAMLDALTATFAVDHHRRREDEGRLLRRSHRSEQDSRADVVGRGIVGQV